MGYDQPRSLGTTETGGGLALPIWINYMGTALKNVPPMHYQVPEGVVGETGEVYLQEHREPHALIPEVNKAQDVSASSVIKQAPIESIKEVLF